MQPRRSGGFSAETRTAFFSQRVILTPVTVAFLAAMISVARADSYTVSIVPGYNMIANHLDHGGNTLAEIIPSPPDGTVFTKLQNTNGPIGVQFLSAQFSAGSGWFLITQDPRAEILNPGEGGYIIATNAFSITFTGAVHTPVLPFDIGTSWAVLSRQTAASGNFEQIVGYPPPDGALVARLIPGAIQPDFGCRTHSTFNFYSFRSGVWSPSEPVLDVGESAWFATNLNFTFPTFLTQPTNQTVPMCQNVTWSTTVTGTPPYCYQWKFNGADITNANADSFTITNATPLNNGGYSVAVGATLGAVTSQVAQLTVQLQGPADLTLTPQAVARGFVLSTFAYNFPPVASGNYLGGPGPLAAAFLTNQHVIVTHIATGNVYEFPTNTDGQDAATAQATPVSGGVAGLAQIPLASGGFSYYMCIQTGSVYEITQQGLPERFITNIDHATSLISAPPNVAKPSLAGHLLVATAGGTENSIWDVDPTNNSRVLFSPLAADGIAFTQDGATLLTASGNQLFGLKVSDATTNFQYDVDDTDGIIAAGGSLLGKAYINCGDGKLWEVDLATGNKTLIASCGTRGDFLYANPFDGSLFITQTDRIKRLRYPGADFFGVPGLTLSISGTTIDLCWPTAYPGLHLERTPTLSPPAWSLVTNSITGSGGQFCVSVTVTGGAGFFRLTR